jgi:hypothetical protein
MSDAERQPNENGGDGGENENGGDGGDGGEQSIRDDLGLDDRQSRAFEELRRENAARRREARAAQKTSDDLRGELERLRVESESDQEKKTREAVDAAVGEVAERYERRLLEASIARRAAGKLRDPDDAVSLLPVDELLAVDDEREQTKRIDDALAELVEAKPYLAEDNGSSERTPSRSTLITQGARSERPGAARQERDADDWIRKRARGR